MMIGLMHSHKYLGYLLFLLLLLTAVLVATGATRNPGLARIADRLHRLGAMNLGRLEIVLGVATLAAMADTAGAPWWRPSLWAGLLLWGPIEPIAKRLVHAELARACAGEPANRGRLLAGIGLEVVLITAIIGLMTMTRLGKL